MILEVLGWVGMVLIVGAYAMLSNDMVSSSDVAYQAANVLGSGALGIQLASRRVYPALCLQIVWSTIGLVALTRILGVL